MSGDRARARRDRRVETAVARVAAIRDRRRFKTSPVPTGTANRVAAGELVGTVFPSRVSDPIPGEAVLKDGASNAKIGGDVLVGRLQGARIVTLTLEERATCPATCALWRACYGNSMPHSRRWRAGAALERRIAAEAVALCAAHPAVLVRLHVLGDFYSEAYVALWSALLDALPGLYVFGFTAWGPETAIGGAVAALRGRHPDRAWIRHSGRSGPWGSFTIDFPTTRKQLGDALVCPEQVGAMAGDGRGTHCGSCAACWSCDRPIVFVEH